MSNELRALATDDLLTRLTMALQGIGFTETPLLEAEAIKDELAFRCKFFDALADTARAEA